VSIRRLLAVALIVLAVAACGAEEPEVVDMPHNIREAWQPEPFAIEAPVLAAIDRACSATITPRGLPLAVVDVRGGSRAILLYAGLKDTADCTAEIQLDGTIQLLGGGSSGSSEPWVRPVGGAVSLGSYGSGDSSSAMGQVGPAVSRVVIRTKAGRQVIASIGPTGWFVAWWPGSDELLNVTGFDATGAQTGTAE
jgi:hypothetical protein